MKLYNYFLQVVFSFIRQTIKVKISVEDARVGKFKYVIVFLQACLTSLASKKKVARGATRQNSHCVTLIGSRAKYSATEMLIRPSAMFLYIGNIITFHGMNIQELPCFI